LEAALAAVDHTHGRVDRRRAAVTCGVGISNAMASAINMLGDVHGAGERPGAFIIRLPQARDAQQPRMARAIAVRHDALEDGRPPCAGRPSLHRSIRAPPRLVDAAANRRGGGSFAAIGRAIERSLQRPVIVDEHRRRHRRHLCQLGFTPALPWPFVLSRSVGALAHAFR
jgi:citrate synthase